MYTFASSESTLLSLVLNNVATFCLSLFSIAFTNILVCASGELKFLSKKNNIIIKIKMKKPIAQGTIFLILMLLVCISSSVDFLYNA